MKTVLIIINNNSTYTDGLCKSLRDDTDCIIKIIVVADLLNDLKGLKKILCRIPKLRMLFVTFVTRRILNESFRKNYDCISLHFLDINYLLNYSVIKKYKGRITGTVWGSDFKDINFFRKFLMRKLFHSLDAVSFDGEEYLREAEGAYPEENSKFRLVRFGLEFFDLIEIKRNYKHSIRKKWGLQEGELAVVCGSYGKPFQNHTEIINQIERIKHDFNKEKIVFFFPLTYGDRKYISKIINRLQSITDLNIRILTEWMGPEASSEFRIITDIQINVMSNDQFSGSVQEALFAGAVLICGEWLPYGILDETNVYYKKIQQFHDLGECLLNTINDFENEKNKTADNPDKLFQIGSWKFNIDSWKNLWFCR